ncbi:MAG: type II toxin-antitoxin system VapB family antitoxin [Myxococcota bacterium]
MRAKIFKNGRSQAVRLPKEFRFEGDEVEISRSGDAVILRPVRTSFSQEFWSRLGEAELKRETPPSPDKRSKLG